VHSQFDVRSPLCGVSLRSLHTSASSDHFIRLHQHPLRNRQTDLLGCLQVDDELKLRRLLHWKVGGFCPFEYLIHISSGAPVQVGNARTIGHKAPVFHKFRPWIYRWEPALYRECYNLWSVRKDDGTGQHYKCVSAPLACRSECSLNINAVSISLASCKSRYRCCNPSAFAAASTTLTTCALFGSIELPRTATRESLGTISFSSSSCFPLNLGKGLTTQ